MIQFYTLTHTHVCVCMYILFIFFMYIHVSILFIFFPIMVCLSTLNIIPCVYSRTLLFIHSMCNSLYLLIPNSQFIPPLPFPLGNNTGLFSRSQSLFLTFDLTHPCPVRVPFGWLLCPVDRILVTLGSFLDL